jgi:hypothetical protein
MTDFAAMNDLKDLQFRRETLDFAWRNDPPVDFTGFSAQSLRSAMIAKSTAASRLARRKLRGSATARRRKAIGMLKMDSG